MDCLYSTFLVLWTIQSTIKYIYIITIHTLPKDTSEELGIEPRIL